MAEKIVKDSQGLAKDLVNDCISRKAALDALEKSKEIYFDRQVIIGAMKDIVRNLPSAQPKSYREGYQAGFKDAQLEQPWIPCSERLPENGRQVLVYARSVHYALAKYDEMREADGTYKKQWVTFDAWKPYYTIKEVIAWMPLPESYREVSETDG